MPSFKSMTLAAAGLVGMATAFPQGGFQNTTGGAFTNGTSVTPAGRNNTSDNSFYCPQLNAQAITTDKGSSFVVQCNTNHFGVVITVNVNVAKRQAALPTNLGDCLDRCTDTATCVGAAFNSVAQTCTLFSSVGAAFTDNNVSFGVRLADGAPTALPAGATATSTIYQTNVVTVQACAPTVTDCPLKNAVVTQVLAVATTEYICPAATIIPVAPVACNCAYGVSTIAGYKSTVTLGSTILIPVTSTVVAIPKPSVTDYKTTTAPAVCATCPAGSATTPAAALTTTVCVGCKAGNNGTATSTMAVFTGAAGQVKAGMGMGAVVAAAAFFL